MLMINCIMGLRPIAGGLFILTTSKLMLRKA